MVDVAAFFLAVFGSAWAGVSVVGLDCFLFPDYLLERV